VYKRQYACMAIKELGKIYFELQGGTSP